MKSLFLFLAAGLFLAVPFRAAEAQVAVTANPDQTHMLVSADPVLAANKKLVYDFWRVVLEAGHLEQADRYLAEGYIQHNPFVPTGRDGFVSFFRRYVKTRAPQAQVQTPLVTITAEGDLVTLARVRTLRDPKDAKKTYTTTAFDMFRVQGGKITEHWDSETL